MKVKIWLLVIFNYLFMFGAPLGVAYWKFAIYDEGVGGSMLYFVVFILFIFFVKKITSAIKKQKAGLPKAIFKLIVAIIGLGILYFTVQYIADNFTELIWVVLAAIGGRVLAFALEVWALSIDKIYVDEIGVM